VTGGGRLVVAWMSHREYRVGLFDATDMEPGGGAVSGMAGADPALYFSVTEPVPPVRLRRSFWVTARVRTS
jgi:hypothetical protein